MPPLLGFPRLHPAAAVVFTLSLLAEAVDRQADGLTSLGVAALLIGMIDPFSAGSLSVQMTFLSSLGILLWTGPGGSFPGGAGALLPGAAASPGGAGRWRRLHSPCVRGWPFRPCWPTILGWWPSMGPLPQCSPPYWCLWHWEQRRFWPCCLWRSRWPRLWPALPLPGFYRWPTGFPPCPGRFGRRGMGLFPWFSPSLWRC